MIAADLESLRVGAPPIDDLEDSDLKRYEGSRFGIAFGGGCAAYNPDIGLEAPLCGIARLPFCGTFC